MPDIAPPHLPPAQFRAAVAAVLMVMLLGAIDQTIVGVALPTIAQRLGGFAWMPWVVSAYLIASTAVTPIYGRLSDLFGRRRVLVASIALFLVASAGCAAAQTMPQLVWARALQGVGGGGLIMLAQAVIADIVSPREQGRYQSYVSMVWALASVAGPVAGGLLAYYVSWRWIFWINLPLALVALVLTWRGLAGLPVRALRQPIDWMGAALLVAGLVALLLPVTRVGQGASWHGAGNLAGVAAGVLLLVVFAWHERRTAAPVLPLALFASRAVRANSTLMFLCFFLFIALVVLVPLRMQLVLGIGANEAAWQILPFSLGIPCAAFFSGRWMAHTGRVRTLQRLGTVLVPLALGALAATPPQSAGLSGLVLGLLGFGFGLQLPTTLVSVQNSVAVRDLGTATALNSFFRLLGGAVGTAVLAAVLMALLAGVLPPDVASHGAEGLVLDAGALARIHARPGLAAALDAPFRQTLIVALVISLVSIAAAWRLPDIHLTSRRHAEALES